MANKTVQYEVSGSTALITLNRAAKLNAIDPEMLAQLELITGQLESAAEVRVVLLTGAGDRAFSVGADIHAWSAMEPLDMWRSWMRNGHRVFNRLAELPQPVVAVLNGYAFGGGLELAMAADIRLAAATAELAMPEVKIGTVPGWAGSCRLPHLIGSSRAKQMIFSGDRISAGKAEHWGLVNEVFSAGELMDAAFALADKMGRNSPVSVQLAKQMINAGSKGGDGLAVEAIAGAFAATTADGREGIQAFREKRAPQFHGK